MPSVLCTLGAIHSCAICTVHCWCHIMLCHLYGVLLVPYIAVPFVRYTVGAIHSVPTVRCTFGAIHCCAICTVHCWCHTMLCHLYVVLLVLYIAVPSYVALLMQYISVPSVLRTVGAIHCCAICTVHCWCHIMLCHLYVTLLVPYIAVPFVCTAELFYCSQ